MCAINGRTNPTYISDFIGINIVILATTVSTYIINTFWIKENTNNVFFTNYFNDILAGILLIAGFNIAALFLKKGDVTQTKIISIIGITFVAGVFWEYITPFYRKESVSDMLDIIAYMIGGLIYYLILKLKERIFLNTYINDCCNEPRLFKEEKQKILDKI